MRVEVTAGLHRAVPQGAATFLCPPWWDNTIHCFYTLETVIYLKNTNFRLILLGRHYRITINLARPPTAESWVQGFMKVTLYAENGIIRDVDLTPR